MGSWRNQTIRHLYGFDTRWNWQDDDQGLDGTLRGSRTIAIVGLRNSAKHGKRFGTADLVAADNRTDAQEHRGANGDPYAQPPCRDA